MTTPGPALTDRLFGRELQFNAFEELLGRARHEGGGLLFRGPAGIGKTSVLHAARSRAGTLGFRVLATAASETEASFPFSGLQPLLLPVINDDLGLPDHLQNALLAALGLREDDSPTLGTVGLAVLSVFAAIGSESAPLCVLFDDVQWLDPSTADVLQFVARRLSADPVVILAAGRDGGPLPVGAMPEIRIGPLDDSAARAVLLTRAPELAASARDRILAEAVGNPLALVELARALKSLVQHPSASPSSTLPMTARLEAAFAQRIDFLPPEDQAVLLAAALAPTASIAELLAAASVMVGQPIGLSALDRPAELALVDLDRHHVRFRHPLIRSSLVNAAPGSSRRAAHAALAQLVRDPERALHHRVEASIGVDDALADELEQVGALALRRGFAESAFAAFDQAATLTAPGQQRTHRMLQAAELSFTTGQPDATRRLLAGIDPAELGRGDQAAARRLAIAVDDSNPDGPSHVWELITLAEQAIAADDDDGALRLLEFATTYINWGTFGLELGRAVVATARRIPAPASDPRVIALLAQALPIEGHLELADRLQLVDEATLDNPESVRLVGFAAVMAGDYLRGDRLLARAERLMRTQTSLAPLAAVLTFRGVAAFGKGQWLLAKEIIDEAVRLAAETSQPLWWNSARQMQAGLAGMYGDQDSHREIINELTLIHQQSGSTFRHVQIEFMRGITAAAFGHPNEAITILSELFDTTDVSFDARTCYEAFFFLADAATVTGRHDVVHRAIDAMRDTVPAPWPAILQSGVDYAQAVTSDDLQAENRFQAALAGPARDRPFDRARVQLAYGRWLRRHQRRLEARELTRTARSAFEQLNNKPFADQAREELRAAGEVTPGRHHADWDQLSPQELQIARLVAGGLSNREIGERLFLSPRTVSSHLYRMYPKLGVTSRTQLAASFRSM